VTTIEGSGAHVRPLWNRLRGVPPSSIVETEAPLAMRVDEDGVVWLSGALESDTVAKVRTALRATDPASSTVLDVSGLHFIDSSGLGCLVAHDDRVRRAGGRFVVRGPRTNLVRVFEVTGALDRLTIELLLD
jgi:anti-sigma B factor antagonist